MLDQSQACGVGSEDLITGEILKSQSLVFTMFTLLENRKILKTH